MNVKLVLVEGGQPIRSFQLVKPETLIGSDPASDIKLRSSEVEPRHCIVQRKKSGLVLVDLGTPTGVFANGEKVARQATLASGDKLRVGAVLLEVVVEEDHHFAIAKRALHRHYGALPPFSVEELRDWTAEQVAEQGLVRLNALVEQNLEEMPEEHELDRLVTEVHRELTSWGPLERLMNEEGVTEVMINGRDQIYIERQGRLLKARNMAFDSDEHVIAVARQILAPLGKFVDRANPLADGRMKDGSRVNVVIPPLATRGPTITVRRFSRKPLRGDDLVKYGSMSPNMLRFLQLCVRERVSIVVAGGTGSGKTTLLNVLSSFIPASERIVTIEDAAELQLDQDHVVTLEARVSGLEKGEQPVLIRDLVKNALRMRPDRIVVGECRGGEALDMLQAMNTGHEGSLTTVHANSPRDVLARLETLIMMAGYNLPLPAIRHQISSAVQLIVMQARFRDGSRKVTTVSEITGIQNETILLNEIFTFKQSGYTAEGQLQGRFASRGFIPKVIHEMRENGIAVDLDIFAQAESDKTF